MAAWMGEGRGKGVRKPAEEEREREAEEAGKVEAAPGVIVGSLRRFTAASIGTTQGLSKPRRTAPIGKALRTLRESTML